MKTSFIWAAGLLLSASAASVELSEELAQRNLGAASGVIAPVETPPVIDGNPHDDVWRNVALKRLRYADPAIDGPAKFGADVRTAVSGGFLYINFSGKVKAAPKPKNRAVDDPAILLDNYFAFCLFDEAQASNGLFIAVNPAGAAYHAQLREGKLRPEGWDPASFQAASQINFGVWCVEMKIAIKDLESAHRGQAVWRANFARCNATGTRPDEPTRDYSTAFSAWMPHEGWIGLRDMASSGKLIYPLGSDIEAVAAKLQAPDPAQSHPLAAGEPPPGFEFSKAQLQKIYAADAVRLVPLVAKAPSIDGDTGDDAWKQAEPAMLGFLDAEIDTQPDRNRTFVRVVCDKENLYAMYECEEIDTSRISADAGQLWTHDVVDLLIDVGRSLDYAGGRYFIMECNAAGKSVFGCGDGFSRQPKGFQCAARVEKNRWIVEMRVAFADLGIDAQNFPKVLGAQLTRNRTVGRGSLDDDLALPNYEFAWRSNLLDTPHVLDRFGVLYLQAGNALPEELIKDLQTHGKDPAKLGVSPYLPPVVKPGNVARTPTPKAEFKQPPAVQLANGRAEISFEVLEPVDAAVAILDEKGNTVRHLAAGRLGPKSPAPFQADSLSQRLSWDFKDDFGKTLPRGNYSVRVSLGLNAGFERVLVGDPQRMSNVMGLAVDGNGVVYVLQEDSGPAHYRIANIHAFDRDGKFVRHVHPPPARLGKEDVAGAGVIDHPDGGWLPVTYQALLHNYVPQFGTLRMQRPAISKTGKLLLINNVDEIRMRVPKRLLRIGTDGSVGRDVLGPLLGLEPFVGTASMALSPDERYLYVTGLSGKSQWVPEPPHHAVYRLDLAQPNLPLDQEYAPVWLGERFVPGGDNKHFNDPSGLAVDAAGNVHVADSRNNRIAVYKSDGTFLRSLAVEAPQQLEIHPKTGALYVLANPPAGRCILKLSADGGELAKLSLPPDSRAPAIMALDTAAEQPVLWYIRARRAVHKVVEKDGKLQDLGDVIFKQGDTSNDLTRQNNLQNFEIVDDGRKIYISGLRYDAVTGKFLEGDTSRPLTRGMDGRLYHFVPKYEIRRFTADGRPDPFPNGVAGSEPGMTGVLPAKRCYYFTVDRSGNVFTISDALTPGGGASIHKYRSDGSLEKADFLKMPFPAKSSGPVATVQCGPDGSLYVACNIKSPSETIPPLFAGRLPSDSGVYPGPRMQYEHYYGSIVKFGADGGKVTFDPAGEWLLGSNYDGIRRARIEGIQWAHLGISPLVYRNRDHARCTCEHASFDMDGFGRIFIPDAFRASIEVIDANANVLTRFGRYGNQDSRGRESPAGEPEIGFVCPVRVRVHDDACLVADRVNHRILRLKLTYREVKEAAISNN